MEPLIINETNTTPEICFDPSNNNFLIKGCSRPEDVRGFFGPVINWLLEFKNNLTPEYIEELNQEPLVFKFMLDYFNSSSAKFILDMLITINQMHLQGLKMRVDWFYDDYDEDMREVGEELSELVEFQFSYIKVVKS